MSLSVLIYSTDDIRGRIIQKSLQIDDVETVLCSTHLQIKEAVNRTAPDIIIFDTKRNFWDELNFLKTLSRKLPETIKIILSDSQNIPFLKTICIKNDLCAPDPLDPEFFLPTVKDMLDLKKKVQSASA